MQLSEQPLAAALLSAGVLSLPALAHGDRHGHPQRQRAGPERSGHLGRFRLRRLPRHRPGLLSRLGARGRAENRVLIYTRTAGPRHANLGPAPGRRTEPAAGARATWCRTRSSAGSPPKASRPTGPRTSPASPACNRYKAVIFASTSRDTLLTHGRRSIRPWRSTPRPARTSTPPRPRCASTCAPAAASSASTTRSAPSTTGRSTKACSATPTTTTTAPTRTARSVVVAQRQLDRRPAGDAGRSATSGTTCVPFPTQREVPATVDENTLGDAARRPPGPRQVPSGGLVPVLRRRPRRGSRRSAMTARRSPTARASPARRSSRALIINGIKSAMGLVPFCTTHGGKRWSRTTGTEKRAASSRRPGPRRPGPFHIMESR